LVALALVFAVDMVTPPIVVVGALSFIPVLFAAWLLSGRLAAVVTLSAILFRLAATFFAGVHPVTALSEVVTIGVVAAVGRFAAVVVTAYWSAQALSEERDRIARDLHDGTIQSLFGIGIGLRTASRSASDPAVRQNLEDAVRELDHVIRDIRNYVFGLRPILADGQVAMALESLAQELRDRTSVTTESQVDRVVATGLSSRGGDIVQMAREALSNVGRHSQATHCWLSLHGNDECCVLEIRDDGRGFNPEEVNGGGQGLRNLRERAAAIGAQIAIETTQGHGTTLRVTVLADGRRLSR
jgi:signal transduction histidine kinase